MTAVWIALGVLGGRALRHVLNQHPTTKPGRLTAARIKTPEGRVLASRLPLRAPLAHSRKGSD